MKNKRGWIKIIETFIAILLVAGVVLVVIEKGNSEAQTQIDEVKEIEISILRQVQLDNDMRQEIVGGSGEIEWDDEGFSQLTKTHIIDNTPAVLECQAKICGVSDLCPLTNPPEKSVVAETVFISSSLSNFNPRVLKLFCWVK